jgi:phosphohistidine phosphatase
MEVYLLRHGIAENARPGAGDAERALTDEGKEKLRRVLKRSRIQLSLILSSPYRRALETAEIAAEVLGYKNPIVRTRALTPEASPHGVWAELREHSTEQAVLLASHEPLMSSLAAFLLESPALQVDMKKAALVRIDCERAGAKPGGVLKWMLTPAVCE